MESGQFAQHIFDLFKELEVPTSRYNYRWGISSDATQEEWDFHFDVEMAQRIFREKFTKKYSWAIPTPQAIDSLVDFIAGDEVLEVGAGSGLWSRLLNERGIVVKATDNYTWNGQAFNLWYPIQKITSVSAVKKYKRNVLMLCWPPMTDMASKALEAFEGQKVIYIGEYDGCTADDNFRTLINLYFREFAQVDIPQWPGLHDAIWLYTRRANTKSPYVLVSYNWESTYHIAKKNTLDTPLFDKDSPTICGVQHTEDDSSHYYFKPVSLWEDVNLCKECYAKRNVSLLG